MNPSGIGSEKKNPIEFDPHLIPLIQPQYQFNNKKEDLVFLFVIILER